MKGMENVDWVRFISGTWNNTVQYNSVLLYLGTYSTNFLKGRENEYFILGSSVQSIPQSAGHGGNGPPQIGRENFGFGGPRIGPENVHFVALVVGRRRLFQKVRQVFHLGQARVGERRIVEPTVHR